ncbi:MAG: glutathionylspermidine synthase family protein, partial [Patescibacteria group bacterium]
TRVEKRAYWDETAYYGFSASEIDVLEEATDRLHRLCLKAVEHVIQHRRYSELAIPSSAVPLIERSWREERKQTRSVYGRFDFSFDGERTPKLLEYNADTPTSLLEAAVIQWYWLQDCFRHNDQWNSLHERLVEAWKKLRNKASHPILHFAHMEDIEDEMNVAYLRQTADDAGWKTMGMRMDDLGWDSMARTFVDQQNEPVHTMFKLYPWEYMVREEFAAHLEEAPSMRWIEPPWKMVLSNKGILAILWELFPDEPCLLPTYFDGPRDMQSYVRKPLLSREGANVEIVTPDGGEQRPGIYGEEGFVFQAYAPLPVFDGYRPVLGAWVVDGNAAGMGIRESTSRITDNHSRFAAHLIL